MKRSKQAGFGLIESILIIFLAAAIVFVIYHFGWGATGKAGEQAMEGDIVTVQKAVDGYLIHSNGLYPTEDGTLPSAGKYKLIMWNANFKSGNQQWFFYPDFIKKQPRHWYEAVWRIDSVGRVSVDMSPEDY